ncbi:hypothetical protein Tco_0043798, partial [Tanacetum coccineum]
AMKESKAYKIYIGFAIGDVPPKVARKFKKAPLSKKDLSQSLVPIEDSPKPAKEKVSAKTTAKSSSGVVIRDTPVESSSKRKEKVDVIKGKGIELSSEVALTQETQFEEVRRKSMRDFYKSHPSGSGVTTKKSPSSTKAKPSIAWEGTGDKPGVPDVTEEESSESEAKSWGKDEDNSNDNQESSNEAGDQDHDSDEDSNEENSQSDKEKEVDSEHETDENDSSSESDNEDDEDDKEDEEDELVKTPSDDEKDTKDESKVEEKAKGDDEEKMNYTTSLLYDDVNIGQNEPVDTDEGVTQKEGTKADENSEISLDIDDAHVTLTKTEVPVTSSSSSSDLASQFLNFLDIPHTNAEIVSPMDILVHHEAPINQITTLHKVPITVITKSS